MSAPDSSDDDEDVPADELAALARGVRRDALREPEPPLAASSAGARSAAYHGPPVAPPKAVDLTVPTGGVQLSETVLQDQAAALLRPPPSRPRLADPSRHRKTVMTTRTSAQLIAQHRRRRWVAVIGAALGLLVPTALLVHAKFAAAPITPPPPASAASTVAPAPPASAPASAASVAPPPASPSASTAPRASTGPSRASPPLPPRRPAGPRQDVNRTF